MRFEVVTGGRRRTIEVRRAKVGWTVIVDGRTLSASLAQAGSRWSLLLGPTEADSARPREAIARRFASHEIALLSPRRGERVVWVDGREVSVEVVDPRDREVSGRAGPGEATGPTAVVSPMPGRIVKVLVRPGDLVEARQGLVVVEAMKMENELRAPRAGRVSEVRAREGATVEASTVLVVLH